MEPFACHRKQRSAAAACNIYLIKKRNVMWIDYQLLIYFIYIYIFLFSCSLTQLLCALAHLSHLLSFIFVYNVTNVVTGLKLQSPKTKLRK